MGARFTQDGSFGSVGGSYISPSQAVGVSQKTWADLGKSPLAAAAAVAQAPATLLMPEGVAVALAASISGSPVLSPQTPGVGLTMVANSGPKPPQASGAELVQVKFDLTQTNGGTSATSGGTWANSSNATGLHNGVFATSANTLTVAASGNLDLSYAAQINKTDLAISDVRLNFWHKYVPGLTSPGTVSVYYSIDAGANWVFWGSSSSAFDYTVTTNSTDLTAAIAGDWSRLTNLRSRCTLVGPASASPSTYSVDAVEVIVTASRTDTL